MKYKAEFIYISKNYNFRFNNSVRTKFTNFPHFFVFCFEIEWQEFKTRGMKMFFFQRHIYIDYTEWFH